jgi:hypothetical protein
MIFSISSFTISSIFTMGSSIVGSERFLSFLGSTVTFLGSSTYLTKVVFSLGSSTYLTKVVFSLGSLIFLTVQARRE